MKQRLISAIVALIIIIPIFIIGGNLYNLTVYILSLLALKEFIGIRETKKPIPNFIKFISFIILTLLIIPHMENEELLYAIDLRVISSLFTVFLIPTVLYHDKKTYTINDAFYMIGGVFFLGTAFHLLILYRNISFDLMLYLVLITIMTDTFAYVTGKLVGKTKLIESVSPNKTWEGLVGGTIMGTVISVMFFSRIINPETPIFDIAIVTVFLSILGQLGDLVFSSIKRYFGKKDFSNIMPGHGGILDRLDSIIFVMLGYLFFLEIL